MALTPRQIELQTLAKHKKNHIDLIRKGPRIERICADTIDNLVVSVTVDRLALSRQFLDAASKMQKMRPPLQRSALSRAYYGMYHAARALSFFSNGGDDHEAHSDLHRGIPNDFPLVEQWRNNLKDARLRRNEADYEPYPPTDADFRAASRAAVSNTQQFIGAVELYLRARGCPV